MEAMGAERIWLYLHDNQEVVRNRTYVGNTYLYLKGLLELLFWADSITLTEVKLRIEKEKDAGGKYFTKLREGYGLTEYRIVKLYRCSKDGKKLKKFFPKILEKEEELENMFKVPIIDLERLRNDFEYRLIISREYEVDDEIGKEMNNLVNSGNIVATNLLSYGPEYIEEDIGEKTPKK